MNSELNRNQEDEKTYEFPGSFIRNARLKRRVNLKAIAQRRTP